MAQDRQYTCVLQLRSLRRFGAVAVGAVLLFTASSAFARATESQRNYATGTGSVVAWWRLAVTAHHLLIAGVTYTGGNTTTITPPAGWTPIDATSYRSDNGSTLGTALYYIADCPAKALHTTETFTFSSTGGPVVNPVVATVQLTEVAGVVTSSPVDSLNISLGFGSAASVTLTGSNASADNSEYGFVLLATTSQASTPGNGTNGFARTSSYLYNTVTQASNLDAGTSHRTNMESTLMISAAGTALSTKITIPNAPYSAIMVAFKVQALYWIGAGRYPARPVNPAVPDSNTCYGYFDDDACWSNASGTAGGTWTGTQSPGANDVVIFDGGGLGDCTMNPWTVGTELAYSVEVQAGYTGTITKRGSDLQLQKDFTLSAGTFVGAAGITLRTDQVTPGTYVGDLSLQGGTFNGNGMTMNVHALDVESGTFSAGGGPFATKNGGITTIAGGTSTFAGTVAFAGALTQTAGSVTFGAGAVTFTGNTALANGSMTIGSGGASFPGSLNLGTAGVVTAAETFHAGSGAVTVTGNTVVSLASVFHADSSSALNFTGTVTVGASASAGTFYLDTAVVSFNNATAATGTSLVVQNASSLFSDGGSASTVTFGNNAVAGAYAFKLTGGTMTLSSSTVSVAGSGNVSTSTGTTLSLGSGAISFPGTVVWAGTVNGGTGTRSFSSTVGTSGAVDLSGISALTFSGLLTVSGGTTTFPSPMSPASPLTVSLPGVTVSGGAFKPGNANLSIMGPTLISGGTTTVDFSAATSLSFSVGPSISNGTTTFGSQTVTFPSLAVSGGTVSAGSATVSVTGTTQITGGSTTLGAPTLMGAVTVSGGTGLILSTNAGSSAAALQSTLAVTGGTFNSGATNMTVTSTVSVGPGTITLGSGTVLFSSTLTQVGGTFNCGTSTLTVTGATSVSGVGTFQAPTPSVRTLIFNGPVTVGGADGSQGIFRINAGNIHFAFPTTGLSPNSLLLQGGTTAAKTVMNTGAAGATIDFGENALAGTNAMNMSSVSVGTDSVSVSFTNVAPTIHAGLVTIGYGHVLTMGAADAIFPESVPIAGTLTGGTGGMTFSGPVSVSGTFSGSSGFRTFSGTLDVTSSGTYTASSGAHSFAGAVTSAGTLTLTAFASVPTVLAGFSLSVTAGTTTLGGYSANPFTMPSLAVSGGTFNCGTNSTQLTISGATTLTGGTANMASGRNINLNGAVALSGGSTLSLGSASLNTLGSTLSVSGGSTLTGGTGAITVTSTTSLTSGAINMAADTHTVTFTGSVSVGGGTMTLGSGTTNMATAAMASLAVPGGTLTAGSGPVTITGAAAVTTSGIINGGSSSALHFNGGLTLGTSPASGSPGTFNGGTAVMTAAGTTVEDGSTFNVGSANITFNTSFALTDSSAFNGMTGTTSFAIAPTLTSGTFSVGTAGTAGIHTFTQNTTFGSGVTLSFPTNKGEIRLSNTRVLTLNGTVTSNVGTASTLPKIDCNGCAMGITVAFGATSTLNINGLEFDNSVATGVSIAKGATFTLLKRLKFLSNKGGAGSTHLVITLVSGTLRVPGCFFDATATKNVTLNGDSSSPAGARALFENQGTTVNGALVGDSFDADGDTNHDNVGDNTMTGPYYGSVIEWVGAVATDTSGTAVGYPTAAFDWNTFQWYGVYVAYKDTTSGTNDVLWLRNEDGTAAYSFTVPQSSGDIVGTPWWDSVNENRIGVDANGNGNATDSDVRIVWIGTSSGHIIKLIDNGSSLSRPAGGNWAVDFSNGGVTSITSPLIEDGTNLYFGGTDGSMVPAPGLFAVQMFPDTMGAGEQSLVHTVGAVSAVTASPSWAVYGGATYLFVGSTATSGQAYVYRVNMSTGAVSASFSGVTATVNDSVRLINNHAYAVTDGGTMHVLDAANFGSGAFTNITGFPYQSAAASPIKEAPYIDYNTGYAYFGDNSGRLYIVTNAGANLANYPYAVNGSIQLTSSPVYLPGSGVIAIGANDGNIYFVDRRNVSNAPNMFRRYFVTSGFAISSVGYDYNTSRYMVASADGKLTFINAADVPDPTNTVE